MRRESWVRTREIVAVGIRANGESASVTESDRWHLGSCTKAMTATLVATFVEDGSLSFSTTLAEAFPGMTIDPAYRTVRIDQLLSHHSGAPEGITSEEYASLYGPGDVQTVRRSFTASILASPPETAPGSGFHYSNTGYVIAGAALEALTGQSWEDLLRERVWEPLGMSSCGFGAPGTPGAVDQPHGHWDTGVSIDPGSPDADNPAAMGPAGTVHCSLADWGKFTTEHIRGANGQSALASAAIFDEMHTSHGDDYGLGWGTYDDGYGGHLLTHTGSNLAWMAQTFVEPGADRAWLVTTNIDSTAAEQAVADASTLLWQRDSGR